MGEEMLPVEMVGAPQEVQTAKGIALGGRTRGYPVLSGQISCDPMIRKSNQGAWFMAMILGYKSPAPEGVPSR